MATAMSAERQKEQAITAARLCMRLLEGRYGARRVILFGSLAGQGPWHRESDIDLAVEGLAPTEFFSAYSACRELLPAGFDLDLVPLEKAYPEMRARILGEVDMPGDPLQALHVLVQDELLALERIAQELEELLASRAEPPTRTELRAIASILHEFYNGVERIFERIAMSLDGELPQGRYGHADLLDQMAMARSGVRPPVVDELLQARLKDYLDFRHFYRHAYGYTLEWDQLRWKAETLTGTLALLREQLHRFFNSLLAHPEEP